MNRTEHIFVELNRMLPGLTEKYQPNDIFHIGMRMKNKDFESVELFFKDLLPTLWNIIDGKHTFWSDKPKLAHFQIESVTVYDSTSQTIYDSQYYTVDKSKFNLKKDGSTRLIGFNELNPDDKEQVVNLLVSNIWESIKDIKEDDTLEDNTPDSDWGSMPWDFQK